MSRGFPSVDTLRERVERALEQGDPAEALEYAEASAARQPDGEGYYLLALCRLQLGMEAEALAALEVAVQVDPEHCDSWVAIAEEALFRREYDVARQALARALRVDPTHPTARYSRGSLRLRFGDTNGAARDLLTAALADPDAFPVPPILDDAMIEEVVDEVIGSLHPSLQKYLENVPILVEESPAESVLDDLDAHPFELLGVFAGQALSERDGLSPWSALPPTITLFRQNIARVAGDSEHLRAELRTTILHEIGHYLGLDEADLAARGLD